VRNGVIHSENNNKDNKGVRQSQKAMASRTLCNPREVMKRQIAEHCTAPCCYKDDRASPVPVHRSSSGFHLASHSTAPTTQLYFYSNTSGTAHHRHKREREDRNTPERAMIQQAEEDEAIRLQRVLGNRYSYRCPARLTARPI
jgi:hypothetical protein